MIELRDIMTDEVAVVSPEAGINDAAEVMSKFDIGSLPVCDGRKPVGIVTDRDIVLREVSADELKEDDPVAEVMTEELVCGTPEMSVEDAAEIMSAHQIRRLPVVEREELVGMVALGDLAVENNLEMEAADALTNISLPDDNQEAPRDIEPTENKDT